MSSSRKLGWRKVLPVRPGLMSLEDLQLESQRDSGFQPRVARNELPWVAPEKFFNPNGVVSCRTRRAATTLGLQICKPLSQGSSFLATLGWKTQSRWDCRALRSGSRAGSVRGNQAVENAQSLPKFPPLPAGEGRGEGGRPLAQLDAAHHSGRRNHSLRSAKWGQKYSRSNPHLSDPIFLTLAFPAGT